MEKTIKDKAFIIMSVLYFICVIGEAFGVGIQNTKLELMFKPFFSIILIVYYLLNNPKTWYLIVLVLSGISDVADIYAYTTGLLPSMVATSLYYVILLFYFIKKFKDKVPVLRIMVTILLIGFCMVLVFILLSNNMGGYLIPAATNTVLLITLCSAAFNYFLQHNNDFNLLFFTALFLFIIANSLYGVSNFNANDMGLLRVTFVTLYAIAHYIICNLVITEQRGENKRRIL